MEEHSHNPELLLKQPDGTFAKVRAGYSDGMSLTIKMDKFQFPHTILPFVIPSENVGPYKSRFYVSDNPNPKQDGWRNSCSGEVEITEDAHRSLFGLDDDEPRKADVSFVSDATIKINLCPELPCHQPPLLWDKLPCDSVTLQVIDALQSHPDELQRLKKCLNAERKPRFAPVTPGRKPLWMKLQEEEYYNHLELLARAGLGSPDEIFHKIKRECERKQYIIREPAIRHNIFREYYYRVVKQYK